METAARPKTTNVFTGGAFPIAHNQMTSPRWTTIADANARPKSRACCLTGKKAFPNSEVKGPPTYAGKKIRKANLAVARSAMESPGSIPKAAIMLMANPSEAENAKAIQNKVFRRMSFTGFLTSCVPFQGSTEAEDVWQAFPCELR